MSGATFTEHMSGADSGDSTRGADAGRTCCGLVEINKAGDGP